MTPARLAFVRRRGQTSQLVVTAALLLAAGGCLAHHGPSTQFDLSQTIRLSGVISGTQWINPHAYVHLDVPRQNGTVERWRCEMRAAAALNRSGWSENLFSPGAQINIEGAPAGDDQFACYVRALSISNGPRLLRYEQLGDGEETFDSSARPAVLSNGQPNISGTWAAPQRLSQPGESRRRPVIGYDLEQSAAGKALSASFDRVRDNPEYYCGAVNIIRDWTYDQLVNRIDQTDDTISLNYGFMDVVRTIYLDKREHPQDLPPSRSGHSIGHWEDNTLVVDTVGFAAGILDARRGILHSDQLHVVERFEFDPDNQSLVRHYRGEDPLHLAAPFESRDVVFLTSAPFEPYNCQDPAAINSDLD